MNEGYAGIRQPKEHRNILIISSNFPCELPQKDWLLSDLFNATSHHNHINTMQCKLSGSRKQHIASVIEYFLHLRRQTDPFPLETFQLELPGVCVVFFHAMRRSWSLLDML